MKPNQWGKDGNEGVGGGGGGGKKAHFALKFQLSQIDAPKLSDGEEK